MADQMKAQAIVSFADAVIAVSESIQPAMDAMQLISEWAMPANFASNLEKFQLEIIHFTGTLGAAAWVLGDTGAIKHAQRMADGIEAVNEIVTVGIEALAAMAEWTGTVVTAL